MSYLTYGIWDKCPTWLMESGINAPPDLRNLRWMSHLTRGIWDECPSPRRGLFQAAHTGQYDSRDHTGNTCFLGVPPVTYPGAVHEVLVVKLSICLLLTAPAAQGMPWGQKLTMDTSAAPTQEKFVGDSKPGFLALMQSYIKIQRGCFQGNLGNSNNNEQEQ